MRKTITAVTVMALVLAACGGDDTENAIEPDASEAAEVEETATTTVTPTTVTPTTVTPTTVTPTTVTPTTVTPEAAVEEPSSPFTTIRPADDEIPRFGAEMGEANTAEISAFLQDPNDDGGPFYMINMIRYRDQAEYPDGRETDLTGEEADAIYGSFMGETMLPRYGHEVVYIAEVEQDLIGGSAWDQIAVVKYASRAAFAEMSQDPEFQEMSIHKAAGVLDTVVLATTLLETPQLPPLEDPPFPATDGDTVMAFMHVFDYRETAEYQPDDEDADPNRSGSEAVAQYSANAGTVAQPLGVQPAAWFTVEATVFGPVDVWDEVRINLFPSHAAFEALTADPTWQAGTHHRTAGLEQTFAIMNQPVVNAFNGMVADLG
ncbi:MAG: hypothetical protein AAGC53_14720 [Actinomycetota bacterium]